MAKLTSHNFLLLYNAQQ